MSYQYQQNQSYPYFQSSQQNYPYSNEYYEPPIIQEIGVINEERLEYIPTRSGQESLIYNQSHFEKFQKDEKQICQVLKANGYNLSHIFCIGGFGILVHGSTKEEQNLAIKIVQNQDQNAINKEKEIHKLLKEENHLIKLIVHITVVDGWDAFIYQKYKSSLDQEYKDYEQRKKTFTEQSLLTFVFDLIHGLIELRRASIIHLDIKKKNILISENGKLVYCDFGISEIKKEKQIIKCRGFTKKQYSPQEQIYAELNYKIDFESDIYSLGKILQDLINLFIQLNPESQLFTFAEGLLQIIKDQMIQEDIKLRSNCYQVHSKVYQLFKKIPLKFICNNQEFEKLEYEIKQYLELNPDYCIKKLNQYQETLFNQNNNNNNNNKLNIDQSKLLENSQIQINKNFLESKEQKANSDKIIDTPLNLDLKNSQIGDKGAKHIADSLEKCQNITQLELNLGYNKIGDKGAKQNADYFKKRQRFIHQDEDQWYNKIGYKGAKHIADYFKYPWRLVHQGEDEWIYDYYYEGAIPTADSLEKSQKITQLELNLGLNEIDYEEDIHTSGNLIKSQKITQLGLNFGYDEIDYEKTKYIIADYLEKSQNITELNLDLEDNLIGYEEAKQIAKSLKK